MTAATSLIDAEELLHHLGWMKRLALSMLGDESLAEDAVSETYLRVLRKPPRPGIPLGGWLNTTLKRNVLHVMRTNRRRQRIEKTADARKVQLEAADPLEQAEATEYAVRTLRDLEEPYRETLLLHFFREMDASAIARELGLSVSGVHTRLDRGKKLLRDHFRHKYEGNWTAPLLLTLGYKPMALSTLVAAGSSAALGLPAILVLVAAGATAGLVWQQRDRSPAEVLEAASAVISPADQGLAVAPAPGAAPLAESRAGTVPPPPAAGDPPSTRWRLRVVTPGGEAVVPAMGWSRPEAPFSILVSKQPFGSSRPAVETRIHHSIPTGQFVPADREGTIQESGDWSLDYIGTLLCQEQPPFHVGLALGSVILDSGEILPGMEELTLQTPISAVRDSLSSFRVQLKGPNGAPITRGQFALSGLDGNIIGWQDRPTGTWERGDLIPGSVVLRAGAPGLGRVAWWVALQPGETWEDEVVLPSSVQIAGSLFLPSGAPATGVIVELEPLLPQPNGEPFLNYLAGVTDERGAFLIAGAAPDSYQLLPAGTGVCRSPMSIDARAGSVDIGRWQLPAGTTVTLAPAFPPGTSWVVTVRDRNTGSRVYSRRMGTAPRDLSLPDGEYQVEIGDPARGHNKVCRTFTVAGQALEIAFSE